MLGLGEWRWERDQAQEMLQTDTASIQSNGSANLNHLPLLNTLSPAIGIGPAGVLCIVNILITLRGLGRSRILPNSISNE